jgi:hypothetical protein
MPKLYIDDYVGIANRLETLTLAFAIRKEFGHEIFLDWPELDSFRVEDTRRASVRLIARMGAVRIRYCNEEIFSSLRGKKIILRALDGPADRLDPIYLDVALKIRLAPSLAGQIRTAFAAIADRPVVGIHLRRGDFASTPSDVYDVERIEWPAVPLWWYEKMMTAVAKREKDVLFFLAATGDPDTYSALRKNFDVLTLNINSPYAYKGPGNQSRIHPVADLFALACCPVILATPISGYSHWAANVLGRPSTCLVPLPGRDPGDPSVGVLSLFGKRLPEWRVAGRQGKYVSIRPGELDWIDLSAGADTGWL